MPIGMLTCIEDIEPLKGYSSRGSKIAYKRLLLKADSAYRDHRVAVKRLKETRKRICLNFKN